MMLKLSLPGSSPPLGAGSPGASSCGADSAASSSAGGIGGICAGVNGGDGGAGGGVGVRADSGASGDHCSSIVFCPVAPAANPVAMVAGEMSQPFGMPLCDAPGKNIVCPIS